MRSNIPNYHGTERNEATRNACASYPVRLRRWSRSAFPDAVRFSRQKKRRGITPAARFGVYAALYLKHRCLLYISFLSLESGILCIIPHLTT